LFTETPARPPWNRYDELIDGNPGENDARVPTDQQHPPAGRLIIGQEFEDPRE